MQLEQLEIEGFLSYRKKQTIDLSVIFKCLVLGQINGDPELSNGAGKSGLLEAIPVCFFGKGSGRADVLDSYINDFETKMFIGVTFKIDSQRYKTNRTKVKNSSTMFEIYIDSRNTKLNEAKWEKTDKTIEEILGLSAKTYSSTIYLNERESLQIITGTSSERKEIIRELLNIGIYEQASKASNKKFDEFDRKTLVNIDLIKNRQIELQQEETIKSNIIIVEKTLKDAKEDLLQIDIELKEKNEKKKIIDITLETQKTIQDAIEQQQQIVKNIVEQKNEFEDEIKTTEQEVENQKNKYEKYKKDVDRKIKEKTICNDKIKETSEKLKQLEVCEEQLKQVSKEYKEKTELKFKSDSALEMTITEAKPLTLLLQKLENFGNVCPVTELECIDLKGNKSQIKVTTELELKNNLSKREKIKEEVKKLTEIITSISLKEDALKTSIKTKQPLNEQLTNFKLTLQSIENEEKRFAEKEIEFKSYLEQTEKDVIVLKEKLKKSKEQIVEAQVKQNQLEKKIDKELEKKSLQIKTEIENIEKNIKTMRTDLDTANQKLGQYKNSLERLENMKKEIEHLSKNNDEYTKQKKIFQQLTNVFGKDGIQKSIIKESIPMLEQYTADFLKIFNDDSEKIKIKFDLDPKKQDGEFKKGGGLDILVLEEGKEPKDLQMYSGGETVRIVFSIVLSLAKLLSLRAGKKHETLIIDEKIAKLDTRGIAQFGQVINEISKIYKQVFIITHIESLKDLINGNEIIVNKTDEDGSLISIT